MAADTTWLADLMASTLPLGLGDADDPEEGPMIGWFLRSLPYVIGVGLAMAIVLYGAVPQFRTYFAQRRAATPVDTAAGAASVAPDAGGALSAAELTRRITSSVDFVRYPDVALDIESSRITLGGTVESSAARTALETDVRRAAPGVDVVNRIELEARATSGTGRDAGAARVATAAVTASTVGTGGATATTVRPSPATTAAPPASTAPPTSAPGTAAAPATTAPAAPAARPVTPAVDAVLAEIRALLAAEPIRFASSDPQPLPESQATLDRLAVVLRGLTEGRIEIAGHTDDVGSPDANLDLSQDRAGRVRNELLARGVPADRLVAVGYGSTRPLVANDTEENRLLNRRIDLVAAS